MSASDPITLSSLADALPKLSSNVSKPKRGAKKESSSTKPMTLEEKVLDSVLVKNRHILLHAPGGCGKSFMVLNRILPENEKLRNPKIIALTGPTGVSASLLGGNTIHSWAGLGIGMDSMRSQSKLEDHEHTVEEVGDFLVKRLRYKPEKIQEICETDILVLDEISMMGSSLFDLFDYMMRSVRKQPRKLFGGLQLILLGDVMQLPPVKDEYFFRSDAWMELIGGSDPNSPSLIDCFQLTEPKRFSDPTWFETLQRVRAGKPNSDDTDLLYSRVVKTAEEMKAIENIPFVTGKRVDVAAENGRRMRELPGKSVYFDAWDYPEPCPTAILNQTIQELLDKHFDQAVPKRIEIRNGARVMLRKNLATQDFYVNGSVGTVVDCESHEDKVLVQFDPLPSGLQKKIDERQGKLYASFTEEEKKTYDKPRAANEEDLRVRRMWIAMAEFSVKFSKKFLGISQQKMANFRSMAAAASKSFSDEPVIETGDAVLDLQLRALAKSPGSTVKFVRKQVPLMLAYSITGHKCCSGDTIVPTDSGLVHIEDIWKKATKGSQDGLNTWTPLTDTKIIGRDGGLKSAEEVYGGEIEPSIKITTELGRTIEGSYRHPLLLHRDGKETWSLLPDIQVGDHVTLRVGTGCAALTSPSTKSWGNAWTEYKSNLSRHSTSIKECSQYPSYINEEICYLIGLFIGDGSYNDKANQKIEFCSADKDIMENFLTILYEQFDVSCNTYNYNNKKLSTVQVWSVYIRRFFFHFGLDYCKSSNKTVPWSVMKNTIPCQVAFLQGLFDTDGGVNKSKVHFTNTAECVVDVCITLLHNLGVLASKRVLKEATSKSLKSYRVQISGSAAMRFKEVVGFRCKRKQSQLESLCAPKIKSPIPKCSTGLYPNSSRLGRTVLEALTESARADSKFYDMMTRISENQAGMYFYQLPYMMDKMKSHGMEIPAEISSLWQDGVLYDRVASISYGSCRMFDLNVAGDHSFVGNSIINHNCQGATLMSAKIDLGRNSIFEKNLAYTMLSRVVASEGLYLTAFDPKSIKAHPEALQFDNSLKMSATQ